MAALVAGGSLLALSSTASSQGIGVDELERMKIPTERRLKRGERIYQNQCAGCHGRDGKGVEGGYPKEKFKNSPPDFTQAQYRYGGGPIQVYNAITKGLPKKAYHPVYTGVLRYQERWAVTHYVRSLGPTEGMTDPKEVVADARNTAENGRCDPQIMSDIETNIGQFLKFKGKEQLEQGKKLYQQNGCAACHGQDGKVTAGMEGLEIPPRNFHEDEAKTWHRAPNPLGIFLTLTNGARGQMRGYSDSLNPEERWAIAHFILEEWVPDKYETKTTQADLRNLCRQRSRVPPPTPIANWEEMQSPEEAIQHAMDRLADDASENRQIRIERYGDVELSANADWEHGRRVYREQCASCHGGGEGAEFPGKRLGPAAVHRAPNRNTQPPTLYLDVRPLRRGHAGGTYRDFAQRSMRGVHATMPEAASVTMLSTKDWKDLQAYVARADGDADVERMPPSKPSKKSDSEDASKKSVTSPSETSNGDSNQTTSGSSSESSGSASSSN